MYLCWLYPLPDLGHCRCNRIGKLTSLGRAQSTYPYTVAKNIFPLSRRSVRRVIRRCMFVIIRYPDILLIRFCVTLQTSSRTLYFTTCSKTRPRPGSATGSARVSWIGQETRQWYELPPHFFISRSTLIDFVKQICISACKDSQIAFEHDKSDTLASVRTFDPGLDYPIDNFLQAIVNLLQAKPKATIKDVMYAVK